jgi:hypothetical protein
MSRSSRNFTDLYHWDVLNVCREDALAVAG